MAKQTKSGNQDRRGFDPYLKGLLVAMPLSLLLLIFYSWKIGLALLMLFAVSFICLEAVSSPPANGPREFLRFLGIQVSRRPILVCLGDSLTHGTVSSSFTPDLPRKLAEKLGMEPPNLSGIFVSPLWVVNCGQNGITSYTILNERLNGTLRCHPDYILLMIGTNDVRAMYKESWSKNIVRMNELPQKPSMENFEANLNAIIDFIQQASGQTQIGVCTLPPMGEDLKSPVNDLIRKANVIIEKTVNSFGEKCTVIPIYARFESILEKKPNKSKGVSIDNFFMAATFINVIYCLMPGFFSWNALSKLFGHILLSDGLHLNDTGKDTVVEVVVEWLLSINVAKAIAVKSM